MGGDDFIPLNSNSKKRKPDRMENHHGGKKKHISSPVDPKLKSRIQEYLKDNKDKQYIDIDDMAKTLYRKHPEYGRKKLRVFRISVEECFEWLLKNAGKEEEVSDDDEKEVKKESNKEPDVTKVKSDMNKTLTDLYRKPGPQKVKDAAALKARESGKQSPRPASKMISSIGSAKVQSSSNAKEGTSGKDNNAKATSKDSIAKPKEDLTRDKQKDDPKADLAKVCSKPKEVVEESKKKKEVKGSSSSVKEVDADDDIMEVTSDKVADVETIDLSSDPGQSKVGQAGGLASSKRSSRASSPTTATSRKRRRGMPDIQEEMSDVKFEHVAGMDEMLKRLLLQLLPIVAGEDAAKTFLLHGPPGCGKTLVSKAVAGQLGWPLIKLVGTEIVSGISGESEQKLRALFDHVQSAAPCVLMVDEIDSICQRRELASKSQESRIVTQLYTCLDQLASSKCQVVVMAATNMPDSLDHVLRSRFELELALGIPNEKARRAILEVVTANLKGDYDLSKLARLTPGYVGRDLSALAKQAKANAFNRVIEASVNNDKDSDLLGLLDMLDNIDGLKSTFKDMSVLEKDFLAALKVIQPAAKREGFATVPDVSWDDIGALGNIRKEIESGVLNRVNYPDKALAYGLKAPTGVLLCGPPGCGKTLVAKAVANQAGINFISVKGPELLNMYVGESEKAVRQVFERAKNSAPCVVFFDEIDALCPRRSSGGSDNSGSTRVLTQLLTEMDGVEGRKGVYVMAATNRPDILDPAILRPGRLEQSLYVGLPNAPDRAEILKAIAKNGPELAPDVAIQKLADKCEGYSGADLKALVTKASEYAFDEDILESKSDKELVHAKHFDIAFSRIRCSVHGSDKKKYEKMKEQLADKPVVTTVSLSEVSNSTEETVVSDPVKENSQVSVPETCILEVPEPKEVIINGISTVTDPEHYNNGDSEPTDASLTDSVPKVRFLPQMVVRIKDSSVCQDLAGAMTTVLSVTRPGTCQVQKVGDTKGYEVACTDLEPFMPSPGEKAKSLLPGDTEEIMHVIRYDADNDETVIVHQGSSKDQISKGLDKLCRIDE